jgi:DNA-binding NarL/FixJ family response regulator
MLLGCPQVQPPPLVASSARAAAGWRVELAVLRTRRPADDVRELLAGPAGPRRVLVLSAARDESEVIESLRGGATSYLVDGQFTCTELLSAVLATGLGHSILSPPALTAVVHQLQEAALPAAPAAVLCLLSRREREVMSLVAVGQSNADIARQLFLADKTVRNHLNSIYAKLEVRSRAEAVVTWLGRSPARRGYPAG